MTTSPIADLSYRNYDGPLAPPAFRWWPIARTHAIAAFKKKSFWVFTILGGSWYAILMIIFYFADSFAGQMTSRGGIPIDPAEASARMFRQVPWNEQFLHGFSMGQLWFFVIALLIGVGTIANDNRANALLVYLSKPCTKLDYLIGKWVGVFIPLCVAVAIPTLFFYAYCFMSYRQFGFLHDPWLILKLLVLIAIPAGFHSSLALGISSLFKQGRVAGATYAGLYFFTLFFTKAMGIAHVGLAQDGAATRLVDNLFYMSVDGIQIGLAKDMFGLSGAHILPFAQMGTDRAAVDPPSTMLMIVLYFGLSLGAMFLAWTRIRAVEVVS